MAASRRFMPADTPPRVVALVHGHGECPMAALSRSSLVDVPPRGDNTRAQARGTLMAYVSPRGGSARAKVQGVPQGSDHVAEQDTDDDEDQEQVMSDVHESVAVGRTRRNPREPSWLTTDMIMTLSIIEEAIPSTYREAEISSKSKM